MSWRKPSFHMHLKPSCRLSPKALAWCLWLYLQLPLGVAQQAPTLTGVVTDAATSTPLSYASVSLLQLPDSTVTDYALTDFEGRFALPFPDEPTKHLLAIQYVGYGDLFVALRGLRPDTTYRFALQPMAVALEEVTIAVEQPVRRQGDTLDFDISHFIDSTEQTVGEVLAKLPGFEVSSEGAIKVMGRPVQRLLIEGEDVAGRQYALITRTLTADVLESVQIFFNYGDNPLLNKLFESGEVAVNLQLKDERRQSLSGEATLGAGTGAFYDGRLHLVALYGRLKQIATIEATNTGRPASAPYRPGTEQPDLVAPTLLTTKPPDLVRFTDFFSETARVDHTRFNDMREASTAGTWRLFDGWRLRAGGVWPRERFNQYTTTQWWYGPDRALNRTDSIERQLQLEGGRAWAWIDGLAGENTWLKAGIEYAQRQETDDRLVQDREKRHARPAWRHTLALASLTHQWSPHSASVFSAEYLSVEQAQLFAVDFAQPIFEALIEQTFSHIRQDDALHSRGWRLAQHYVRKAKQGTLIGGLAWTERRDEWRLAQTLALPDTPRSTLALPTAESREGGAFLRFQHRRGSWQWEGDLQSGLLHFRMQQSPYAPTIDQRLPYLNGGIRLSKESSAQQTRFWLRFRKNLPSSSMQLEAPRLTDRYAFYHGMAAPLVQQRFELGIEWRHTRLIPWRALSAQAQLVWGHNAWTPSRLLGTEMAWLSWADRPAPIAFAQLQTTYEHLFESVAISFKAQPSLSFHLSEELFDGLARAVRQTGYGLSASLRTGFDAPLNLMVGTRLNRSHVQLQPENNGPPTLWTSLAWMPYVDLYVHPAQDLKMVLSSSWFAMRNRSGSYSRWWQLEATLQWNPKGPWSLRLSANNLADAAAFVTFTDSSFLQTTRSQQILPRYLMAHLSWKFSTAKKQGQTPTDR